MSKYTLILESWGKHLLQPKFFIPGKPLESNSSQFPTANTPEDSVRMNSASEDCELTSMFGTPVWADVIIKDNVVNGRQLQLLWVLVTVSMRKHIVETIVQGRPGTVKEYVCDGDYEITMEGGLFDQNPNRYPVEDMNTLVYLMKLAEALPVTSEYLQMFGIHNVVVVGFDFRQQPGSQNVQLFSIKALSDEPIELVEE